jgi:hypothetical protein
MLLLLDPRHLLELGPHVLRCLFPHLGSHDRDVLVLDLDRRRDEVRVGDVLAEEDEGVSGALDVAFRLLLISSSPLAKNATLTFLAWLFLALGAGTPPALPPPVSLPPPTTGLVRAESKTADWPSEGVTGEAFWLEN